MEHLADRVAVVTGAASGLGRALAQALALERMHVVAADVDRSGLEETVASLAAGVDALAVPTDVADAVAVEALAEAAYGRFGAVHVVCNNAGVHSAGTIWDATLADWEWCFGVNMWGVVHGIRSFVPRMIAGGDEGHIVNTSSMAGLVAGGRIARSRLGIYAATKHAVVAITESLLAELTMDGSRVGASVLCPSGIRTRIWDAGRNRPEHLRNDESSAEAAGLEEALRLGVEVGRAPSEVADLVVDAIRRRVPYIYTEDHSPAAVLKHTKARVELRMPEIG